MRSRLYDPARELFATAQLNWLTGTWRGIFLPESYVPDFTDQFLDSIPVNVRVATSEPINNRTATHGVCSGDHITFPLLFDNRRVTQLVIFRDTGVESTSPLVAYVGDDDLITEPFIPLGLDYFVYPNAVEGGFFRI